MTEKKLSFLVISGRQGFTSFVRGRLSSVDKDPDIHESSPNASGISLDDKDVIIFDSAIIDGDIGRFERLTKLVSSTRRSEFILALFTTDPEADRSNAFSAGIHVVVDSGLQNPAKFIQEVRRWIDEKQRAQRQEIIGAITTSGKKLGFAAFGILGVVLGAILTKTAERLVWPDVDTHWGASCIRKAVLDGEWDCRLTFVNAGEDTKQVQIIGVKGGGLIEPDSGASWVVMPNSESPEIKLRIKVPPGEESAWLEVIGPGHSVGSQLVVPIRH